jgi:protein-L-isoaspartate(D-aspartate) O-methyltransferase
VFTIERHDDLSLAAERVLDSLGYGDRVSMCTDDGTLGWPEAAPFDRILVTAAGPGIPPSLAAQLREGGLLLMPVGDYRGEQHLTLVEKWEGALAETALLDVRFVPLVGREGFGRSAP